MELISKYFPGITHEQYELFRKLLPLYKEWNAKINVISRKDIDNLYLHHVLHSLSIAKAITFRPGTQILDIGTGGGFPGIPLAVMFPECHFHLVDSIAKKIKVVESIISSLGIKNASTEVGRAEQIKSRHHFIVSRAVTNLGDFTEWCLPKIAHAGFNDRPNGIFYLKGGTPDTDRIKKSKWKSEKIDIFPLIPEDFFMEKFIVYLSLIQS